MRVINEFDAGEEMATTPAAAIPPTDADAAAAAAARQGQLTKPAGALGRLEELSIWAAGVQGRCPPEPFRRVRVVVFAGDHGVATAGVSAYPCSVTAQMVGNFLAGGAGVNVLAGQVGATVRVVDLAVDADTAADVGGYKVRRSSGRIDREDALTAAEAAAGLDAGRRLADEEIDAGADLLIPGDMGIGNTTPCAALVALVADAEAATVTGRGTGLDDEGWARKAAVVDAAIRRVRPAPADPVKLLARVGGADLAAMTGFLLQAAHRRTPAILDGVVAATCALLADLAAPGARQWWLAGSRSTEPAQSLALARLDLSPVLDLGLRLGEGTGALLAVPVLTSAIATLAQMSTFSEAGVDDRG